MSPVYLGNEKYLACRNWEVVQVAIINQFHTLISHLRSNIIL